MNGRRQAEHEKPLNPNFQLPVTESGIRFTVATVFSHVECYSNPSDKNIFLADLDGDLESNSILGFFFELFSLNTI